MARGWIASGALLCSLVLAGAGRAQQIYKWVDENGVVHATSELSEVPQRYRAGASKGQKDPSRPQVPAAAEKASASRSGRARESSRDGEQVNPLKAAIEEAERECKYSSYIGYRSLLSQGVVDRNPRLGWDVKHDEFQDAVAKKQQHLQEVENKPGDYGVAPEDGERVDDTADADADHADDPPKEGKPIQFGTRSTAADRSSVRKDAKDGSVDDARNVERFARDELEEAEEVLRDFLLHCPDPSKPPFVIP